MPQQVVVKPINAQLFFIIRDLKCCPVCAVELDTLYKADNIVGKQCPTHNEVFLIYPSLSGYEIKVNLFDA